MFHSINLMGEKKYKIKYEDGKEWMYEVYRYDEDITEMVRNNFTDVVVLQLLEVFRSYSEFKTEEET